MYFIRLDDACAKRDVEKWNQIEVLLDKYNIRPIVGIIPNCMDSDMDKYPVDEEFWQRAAKWQEKGWHIALHGYDHVFCSNEGGVNPVNRYSEFAGVSLEIQRQKFAGGIKILEDHGITPTIFFAPAHTYDANTLLALKEETNIRIVSDTIAYDNYRFGEFTFIPQQSGRVRKLPFKTVTFCYHPNSMTQNDFDILERFISDNQTEFADGTIYESKRKLNLLDRILKYLYFSRR